MKKFTRIIMLAFVAVATMGLSSCDDEQIARDLDGIWSGEVASEVFVNRFGTAMTYTRVEIEFFKNPSQWTGGQGVEYDYDRYNRCTRFYFNYHVTLGTIYLEYEDGTRLAIDDYRLSGNRFTGSFLDYYTRSWVSDFDFYRIDDHLYYAKPGKYEEVPSAKMRKK